MGQIIWPRITNLNPNRDFVIVTGGLEENTKRISDQCLEINLKTLHACNRNRMPEARYGHG